VSEDEGACGGPAGGGPGPAGHGNGLRADSYVVLTDVDPRIAGALLERLAEQGIAAYLAPAGPAPGGPGGSGDRIPGPRPAERLYVDRAASERARALLSDLPTLDPVEGPPGARQAAGSAEEPLDAAGVEQRWLAIVADLSASPPDTVHTWPEAEDLGPPRWLFPDAGPAARGSAPSPGAGTAPPADFAPAGPLPGGPRPAEHLPPGVAGPLASAAGPPSTPRELPASAWRTWSPDRRLDDDPLGLDEHYVPPEPPPVPRPHTATLAAVLCIVAGFLLMVAPGLIGQPADGAASGLGAVALIGGCVALIYRLRDGRRSDDDKDDGAVV
jgi:hypothetical protein